MITNKYFFVIVLIAICSTITTSAQQSFLYNHYYLNPFLYNPSLIAQKGYSEVYLNYRKQWTSFEGAPTTVTMNLHMPLNYKSGLAFTAFQDEAGMIKTTTGLVSFSYQVFLGRNILDLHKIGFGLSAGYTASRISAEDAYDFQDPVLGNRTSSLDGQFGMHYQYNRLRIAFAIPRLFQNNVAAEEEFTHRGITQIKQTISSISYEFRVNPTVSVEPVVTYRTNYDLDPQIEALASVNFSNIGWIGGGFRQDYGAFGFMGFTLKEKLKIGYAYEFATDQTDRLGLGSHEIQLVLRIGKKQFTRPQRLAKSSSGSPANQNKSNIQRENVTEDIDGMADTAEENGVNELAKSSHVPSSSLSGDSDQSEETRASDETSVTRSIESQEIARHADKDARESDVAASVPVKLNGQDLAPGHYVVVGAFVHLQNATNYAATLKRAGYPANVAFHPDRNHYIVHMRNAPEIEEARAQRDKYRQMSRYSFRDTWILSVE